MGADPAGTCPWVPSGPGEGRAVFGAWSWGPAGAQGAAPGPGCSCPSRTHRKATAGWDCADVVPGCVYDINPVISEQTSSRAAQAHCTTRSVAGVATSQTPGDWEARQSRVVAGQRSPASPSPSPRAFLAALGEFGTEWLCHQLLSALCVAPRSPATTPFARFLSLCKATPGCLLFSYFQSHAQELWALPFSFFSIFCTFHPPVPTRTPSSSSPLLLRVSLHS